MTSKNLVGYDECKLSNWLCSGSTEWTQSLDSNTSYYVWYVDGSGYMDEAAQDGARDSRTVRPVINLKSEVKIVNGTGKEDDPYILELS